MTLGGLAVAIGELVDDAVVDVENIFRRLKENRHAAEARACRSGGVPGEHGDPQFDRVQHDDRRAGVHAGVRLGRHGRPVVAPVGVAYIVSIVASLLVSLTLTPVLSYWLLGRSGIWPWVAAVLAPVGGAGPVVLARSRRAVVVRGCRTQASGGRVCPSGCTWLVAGRDRTPAVGGHAVGRPVLGA